MRLCDTLKVRRFLNAGSVKAWFKYEVGTNYRLNRQTIPLELRFGTDLCEQSTDPRKAVKPPGQDYWQIPNPPLKLDNGPWEDTEFNQSAEAEKDENGFTERTIALIAHDRMKERMMDFAVEYEHELGKFERVLATGTTGEGVKKSARQLGEKVCPVQIGSLGGRYRDRHRDPLWALRRRCLLPRSPESASPHGGYQGVVRCLHADHRRPHVHKRGARPGLDE